MLDDYLESVTRTPVEEILGISNEEEISYTCLYEMFRESREEKSPLHNKLIGISRPVDLVEVCNRSYGKGQEFRYGTIRDFESNFTLGVIIPKGLIYENFQDSEVLEQLRQSLDSRQTWPCTSSDTTITLKGIYINKPRENSPFTLIKAKEAYSPNEYFF